MFEPLRTCVGSRLQQKKFKYFFWSCCGSNPSLHSHSRLFCQLCHCCLMQSGQILIYINWNWPKLTNTDWQWPTPTDLPDHSMVWLDIDVIWLNMTEYDWNSLNFFQVCPIFWKCVCVCYSFWQKFFHLLLFYNIWHGSLHTLYIYIFYFIIIYR